MLIDNQELIKYNGAQIAPRELEDLVRQSEHVLDTAVAGMELDDGNELPTAFVVLANNADIQTVAQETTKMVNEQVSPYKQLRGGVHAVKAIPRNFMGKPLLGDLREMAKALATQRKLKPRL